MREKGMCKRISADILSSFPPVDEERIDQVLQKEMEKNQIPFVVLDDDPTGVQTVHDISVYTDWSVESIKKGLEEKNRIFYILTNSRALTASQTIKTHREIACNVERAVKETGRPCRIISRSDSTLRGHYPLETQVLREKMEEAGQKADGEILCPFFKEGGRFTINHIHYVKEGNVLIPAGDTEFAKDRHFGYTNSDLCAYIEEKTEGAYPAKEVVCIQLEELRTCNYEAIEKKLCQVHDFQKVVVDAVDYCDIKVFAVSLYRAMERGKNYIYRTAAGFVKIMGGITDRPLLTKTDMLRGNNPNGGIVVVGSHTEKTTRQLECLLSGEEVEAIPFHSELVLEGEERFQAEITRAAARSKEVIKKGKTAVCYTSRKVLGYEGQSREEGLGCSVRISEGVQSLVGQLDITPRFVIAKGGITSSDIGTKALKVKRATVLGQIRPGIPVWQTGYESKFPGIPFVVFPGNVGDETTLLEIVKVFCG